MTDLDERIRNAWQRLQWARRDGHGTRIACLLRDIDDLLDRKIAERPNSPRGNA
jgi:hypothetical protein